jgi:hypothetical protein
LVLLKTVGPDNHMATAQKLFLFWRKPAVSWIFIYLFIFPFSYNSYPIFCRESVGGMAPQ